jgi:molybdopterin synthase catalytic subunit
MIEITDKSIDITKVIAAASHSEAGAVNIFIGNIRDTADGKKVVRLEYEAYEPMAVAEIQKIRDEATRQWNLSGFAMSHRVGTLIPGETAVVVAVSSKHRKESFEACQFIMNELKKKVPIFKKEVFEDGEEWIGALS